MLNQLKVHLLKLLLFLLLCTTWHVSNATPQNLIDAAIARTHKDVKYTSKYIPIAYPGGDIPDNLGVCSDLIIRAYRNGLNVDLQKLVHEDMLANFDVYPNHWGLNKPDKNIDHRRVPNLQVFFSRYADVLPITKNILDYAPGDIVTWNLNAPRGFVPHIGIVSDQTSEDGKRLLVIHNINHGPVIDDMIFMYDIIGHYRYIP